MSGSAWALVVSLALFGPGIGRTKPFTQIHRARYWEVLEIRLGRKLVQGH